MEKARAVKVVITGGPSGGKTTLIEALKRELGNKVFVVPEAASILFKGGFLREKSDNGIMHTQRAIYFTQRELESIAEEIATPQQLIVCDRGSLDGMAYWPQVDQNFYQSLHTTEENELSRYDWVIHLDTAGAENYDLSNPIRTESYQEAFYLNDRIKTAWSGHHQKLIIGSKEDFISKMQTSLMVIKNILSGVSHAQIRVN